MASDGRAEAWSHAAMSVWGKTEHGARWGGSDQGGQGDGWLPLVQHLEDAAGVAGHLWDRWAPRIVRERLGAEVGSQEMARSLLTLLAGAHDVGKATPAFAQLAYATQRGELVSAMERQGLRSRSLPRPEMLRHTVTGHVAFQEWLMGRYAFPASRATALASVVSAHHGTPQADGTIFGAVRSTTGAMGDDAWDAVRHEILDTMTERTGAAPVLAALRDRKLSLFALIDLSAVVVMADWIASDETRFPYALAGLDQRLDQGVADLDLRFSWEPEPLDSIERLFAARFPHLGQVEPTPLQQAAVEVASTSKTAPLLLIEAPTGAGKSEAAFMAAEVLASRFGAGGVYVGLPTMATSNAMFSRVLRWIENWPGNQDPAVWLAHGKAALNEEFRHLSGRVRQVYDDDRHGGDSDREGPARVSSWLQGRRRGLLASVVVGTIDQVLMGALQARHLALRHLALSSKVVIVDEVHSADVYMRSYLVRMLEYLGGYGTPVILLSATLPPAQRGELIAAYERGRRHRLEPPQTAVLRRRPRRRGPETASAPEGVPGCSQDDAPPIGPGPEAYPLVTVAAEHVAHLPVAHDDRRLEVRLERQDDGLQALIDTVTAALEEGGCIAVLRNTVRRAQEAYDALRAHLGQDVELFHSRFLAADRAVREAGLVRRLGPPGPDRQRPDRLVVVGTQVLEQSLDVDFDLLITDLAPVDLIIQRIGRLHRHERLGARPPALATPRCLITGVEDWDASVPVVTKVLTYVNEESLLLHSLAVLAPYLNGTQMHLPQDGPVLVHRAYDPGLAAPAGWETAWDEANIRAEGRRESSRSRSTVGQTDPPWRLNTLTGWTATPADDRQDSAGRAQVRDSEDGIEVILVQRTEDDGLRLLDGNFPGAGRPLLLPPDDGNPTVRHLAACTVSLPQALTNPGRWADTLGELETNGVADEWQQSRWLSGQLVLALDTDGTATLNDHLVSYDEERGLDVARIAPEEQV